MPKALHGTTYVFDYILAIAQHVFVEKTSHISYDEMYNIMKTFAIRVQVEKEIEAGKRYKDYRKKAQDPSFLREAADKTVAAMTLWGMLERYSVVGSSGKKEKRYRANRRLYEIGEAILSKKADKARIIIFDRILRSEEESEFTPQTLTRIRDSTISSEFTEFKTNYALPDQGVIPWSAGFVRNNFQTSPIDFKLIISWFQELRILNVFNPRIIGIKMPQEIYLTAWIATDEELTDFYNQIIEGRRDFNSFASQNCLRLLEIIGAVEVNGDRIDPASGNSLKINENSLVKNSLVDPYDSKLVLVRERDKSRYLISATPKQVGRMFMIVEKDVNMGIFRLILSKYYNILKKTWKTPYVWISPLRALCCRSIMISDECFDLKLTQLYEEKPEAIEFSKAATGIFRSRVRIFEKPFKLYNNPFRMVRLVENL